MKNTKLTDIYGTEKNGKKDFLTTGLEFENLVMKNIPGWMTVWNILALEGKETRSKQYERIEATDLQKRIRRKILELVDEEETLVNLYGKAAEVAKREEEDFKGKTVILMRQIEKDKNMMKTLTYQLLTPT